MYTAGITAIVDSDVDHNRSLFLHHRDDRRGRDFSGWFSRNSSKVSFHLFRRVCGSHLRRNMLVYYGILVFKQRYRSYIAVTRNT